MTTARPSMTVTEWGLLLLLSVIWGGSFFFTGVAVRELPPLTIVAARVGLAALALHSVVRLSGKHMPTSPKIWLGFLGMGLLNNILPFSLIVWAQTHIESGLASILNATTPLFGVVVAHLLTRDEKMTGNRLSGVLVGFAGVAVMIGPSSLSQLGQDLLAQIAILCAALSYAFAGVYGRRFRLWGLSPMVTACGQLTASSVVMLIFAMAFDHPWTLPAPSAATIAAVIAIALISTALAYVIFFRILASAGATNIMLVTFLIPVSAIILGAVFLGERLAPQDFAGMAIILLGLALIDGRLWPRVRRIATHALDRGGRG